jgi:hypothetical protein
MDIVDYLKSTRLVHEKGAAPEPQSIVDYLLSSAKDTANVDFTFCQINSSSVSHQAIRLDDQWYIVWDTMLSQTCSNLLYGLGNASYFANKLVRYPYASAALAMLASERRGGVDALNRDD